MKNNKCDVNEILSTTILTIQNIKKYNNGWDAILLYLDYMIHWRKQGTNQVWCTDFFMQKSMDWKVKRFKNAKKILKELGLIEQTQENLKTWWFWKVFTKINFIINLDNTEQKANSHGSYSEQWPCDSLSDENPLNALSNKSKMLKVNKINTDIEYSCPTSENFSDCSYVVISEEKLESWVEENSNLSWKEKNAAKKEKSKIDKLEKSVVVKEAQKWLLLLENKIIPETKIDKMRILLYVFNTLQNKNTLVEDKTMSDFQKAIDRDKLDYMVYIEWMWRLQHNLYSIDKWVGREKWKWWISWWNLKYLLTKWNIDKAINKTIDQKDTETSSMLREKLKYLVTLPSEYNDSSNGQKSTEKQQVNYLTKEEQAYMDKNTFIFTD